PLQISLSAGTKAADKGMSERTVWRIAGLVQKNRLNSESYGISYTIVLLFVFLFLLVIVAWPFLKVLTLGPHDQLARHDVILLCLAAVSTTALVTFFVVDVYRYADLEERVDAQLSNLASDIKCRFDDDLHSLLKAVERIRQTPPPQQVPR